MGSEICHTVHLFTKQTWGEKNLLQRRNIYTFLQCSGRQNILYSGYPLYPERQLRQRLGCVYHCYSLPAAQSHRGPGGVNTIIKADCPTRIARHLFTVPQKERKEGEEQPLTLSCIDQAPSGPAAPSCPHLGCSPQC